MRIFEFRMRHFKRIRTKGKGTALGLAILMISGCQTNISEIGGQIIESSTSVVAKIKNIPSAIVPSAYESTAFIDRDFSIPNASVEADGNYTVVKTYFATNRSLYEEEEATSMFGDGRGTEATYGKSYVTVRRSGDTFDIEPDSLVKFDIVEEPTENASLSHNEIFSREDFSNDVNSTVNRSGDNSLLIFIHGFNISFEEAAVRSAQLSYDLGFSGTTAFFSWPSRSALPSYIADVESARASQRYFEAMISDMINIDSANRIYIVTENLGARLTSRVMAQLFRTFPEARRKIRELVLVAPDIEIGEFTDELLQNLGTEEYPVTLYTSSSDSSLAISKTFNVSTLAGDSSHGVLISDGLETIDAGELDASFSTHSSYLDTNSIVADIWTLIEFGTRANSRRLLTARYTSNGTYWEYTQ